MLEFTLQIYFNATHLFKGSQLLFYHAVLESVVQHGTGTCQYS